MIQDSNIIPAKGYAFTDLALKVWECFDLYDNEVEKVQLGENFSPD